MTRKSSKLLVLLAGLAALLIAVVWFEPFAGRRSSGPFHPAVQQKLPDMTFVALTGDSKTQRSSDLAGRVLLINFWGTWCLPCQKEFPHLVLLQRKYSDQADFQLLAVSCGQENDPASEFDELRDNTYTFLSQRVIFAPTYADPGASARLALRGVGAFNSGFPTTVIVDRQGTIRGVWEGYAPGTEQEMDALVARLLVER